MIQPQMNTDLHRLNDVTFAINGCAMSVLNAVGHGFHEKIYENALAIAFDQRGLKYSKQKSFDVMFENHVVGTFVPDFVVEDEIIVELKTIDKISNNEKGQVLNYLRATGLRLGIILNFKNAKLEFHRIAL